MAQAGRGRVALALGAVALGLIALAVGLVLMAPGAGTPRSCEVSSVAIVPADRPGMFSVSVSVRLEPTAEPQTVRLDAVRRVEAEALHASLNATGQTPCFVAPDDTLALRPPRGPTRDLAAGGLAGAALLVGMVAIAFAQGGRRS